MNDGGPAFPMHERVVALRGMSLRAWLAGQALNYACGISDSDEEAAEIAVRKADAVIKELEKGTK